MIRIGVTGLMASGKSTVSRRFEERGALRVDGDALGWETLGDPEIRDRIGATFGSGVIGAEGAVDRARLGAIVFGDEAAMARLNAIVQPSLLALVRRRLEEADPGPGAVIVLDAAMLPSWQLEPELDGVVEVTATEAVRIARLRAARGYDEATAARRVRGQQLPPVGVARRLWRIENDGDFAALLRSADQAWGEIESLAAASR